MGINWDVTNEEMDLIQQIVDRGEEIMDAQGMEPRDRVDMLMDLTACHANGTPLRLAAMLEADDFNFAHDFFGIQSHIDRETAQMTGFFLPRFADTSAEL